jgi:hypothetical protein
MPSLYDTGEENRNRKAEAGMNFDLERVADDEEFWVVNS